MLFSAHFSTWYFALLENLFGIFSRPRSRFATQCTRCTRAFETWYNTTNRMSHRKPFKQNVDRFMYVICTLQTLNAVKFCHSRWSEINHTHYWAFTLQSHIKIVPLSTLIYFSRSSHWCRKCGYVNSVWCLCVCVCSVLYYFLSLFVYAQ